MKTLSLSRTQGSTSCQKNLIVKTIIKKKKKNARDFIIYFGIAMEEKKIILGVNSKKCDGCEYIFTKWVKRRLCPECAKERKRISKRDWARRQREKVLGNKI